MQLINARRVRLVTQEMLLSLEFDKAGKHIDAAISRGSIRSAKRQLTVLMDNHWSHPSERTLELFIEMHRRWNQVMDVYTYLQEHWGQWATWEDRLELICEEFGHDPQDAEVIHKVHSSMKELGPDKYGYLLGKSHGKPLLDLLELVRHYRQNAKLRHALILLTTLRQQDPELNISELRRIFADKYQNG